MKLEEIKQTVAWKTLSRNGKFEEEFAKIIRRCNEHVKPSELHVEVSNNQIKLFFSSKINNRDLDSQYKLFDCYEIFLDDGDLIIKESSGRLESNYGYDFSTTMGGKLITNYSMVLYDESGIELFYQSYCDKYIVNQEEFDNYQTDLSRVVLEKYNPNLSLTTEYSKPNIVGSTGRFLKRMRSKNNLGIVEVSEYFFDEKERVSNSNLEYYFNTFLGTKANCPELMHVMDGYPFATFDGDHLEFSDDYVKLGLTFANYQDVARERFLKELKTEREKHYERSQNVLNKYDMMINKIQKELGMVDKTF